MRFDAGSRFFREALGPARAAGMAAALALAGAWSCTDKKGADAGSAGGDADIGTDPGTGTGTGGGAGDANGRAGNGNAAAQQPNGPAIAFRGRFDTVTNANVAGMSWPGTEMAFGFRGTRLSVTLEAPDKGSYDGAAQALYMAYAVDGGNAQVLKLATGKSDYVLAQSLPEGQHTVRLAKMTEDQIGRVLYHAVATDGAMTYTPPVSGRRIEFVGDSGTAGYGALGTYPCSFSSATESADVAYPALVGRLLDAEVHNCSYSGKGLLENRDYVGDAEKTLPVLWQRTLPRDDPYVLWDANAWRPQAVIALVSGNDVYHGGAGVVPSQEQFTQKVGGFIKQLRAAYPQALLMFGASPMLRSNDPGVGQRATAIARLKATVAAAGDANVQFIDLPQDNGFNGNNCGDANCLLEANSTCLGSCTGCDSHPTPYTHSLVASSIAATLKAKLRW
jgi:lysophospholipase L1-like esterase